jgi:transposase
VFIGLIISCARSVAGRFISAIETFLTEGGHMDIFLWLPGGLRWCDAPSEYGPPKTLYNRWKRWSDMGVFARIMMGLAEQAPDNRTISIDATYLKAHRTASSLGLKKGGVGV